MQDVKVKHTYTDMGRKVDIRGLDGTPYGSVAGKTGYDENGLAISTHRHTHQAVQAVHRHHWSRGINLIRTEE